VSDLPVEPLFLAEQKNSIIQATIFDDDGDFRSTFAGDVCLCVIARVGLCETGLASPDDVHCKPLSMLTSLSEKLV
jgi:hypothetical protein